MLTSIIASQKSYKEKKTEVLENADLLLKGQKWIYSGFMNGIFDSSDMHTSGREEDFSEKYNDDDDDDDDDDADDDDDDEFAISKGLGPRDMSDLESEESTEQRRNGLKILTPDQMLSRLPISLAQLKAGKN